VLYQPQLAQKVSDCKVNGAFTSLVVVRDNFGLEAARDISKEEKCFLPGYGIAAYQVLPSSGRSVVELCSSLDFCAEALSVIGVS